MEEEVELQEGNWPSWVETVQERPWEETGVEGDC
jgi:hypothetical protein